MSHSKEDLRPKTLTAAIYSFVDTKEVFEGVDLQKVYTDLAAAYGEKTKEFLTEKYRHSGAPVSCNSCTKCPRQSWYKFNRLAGEPMHPRGKLNFRTGHIVELELYMYAALGGAEVDFFQHRYDWNIGDQNNDMFDTSAYIDFRYKRPNGKRVLVDVKTISDIGFKYFVKDGPDDAFGYLGQFNQYIKAALDAGDIDGDENDPPELIMLGYKKSTGHIHEHSIKLDVAYLEQAASNAQLVDRHTTYVSCPTCDEGKKLNQDEKCDNCRGKKFIPDAVHGTPPPRPEWLAPNKGRDGRWSIALQCNYCDHKHACWTYPRMDDLKFAWSDKGEMVVTYPDEQKPIQKLVMELSSRGKPVFYIEKDQAQMEIFNSGA
jgi:hypothetical protein